MTTVVPTGTATPEHQPGLFAIWFPIIGPLAAWAVHLIGEAALVRSAQQHSWVVWVMHAMTVVLASVAVAGLLVASRLARAGALVEGGEESGAPEGRTAFLGLLGLASAGFNLALIVGEGLVIVWVHRGA